MCGAMEGHVSGAAVMDGGGSNQARSPPEQRALVASRDSKEAASNSIIIIVIIEGLSLLQSIPPTTANKQTQAQKKRGSMASRHQPT